MICSIRILSKYRLLNPTIPNTAVLFNPILDYILYIYIYTLKGYLAPCNPIKSISNLMQNMKSTLDFHIIPLNFIEISMRLFVYLYMEVEIYEVDFF